MGSCVFKREIRHKQVPLELDQISRYPRVGKLIIRSKNPQGKIMGHASIHFNVTEPIKLTSKQVEISNAKHWVSSCVLPGLDPRGDCNKGCQDNCIYIENDKSILLALFDGHGSDGAKVSQFCCKFIESYYLEKFHSAKGNITEFLVKLSEDCDTELRHKGYDILYSGSTGVFIIIFEGFLYCGSVGDSRAILGSTNLPEVLPAQTTANKPDRKLLEEVKQRRESKSNPLIQAVQLTKDQRPEDPEEYSRIMASGGRVQRLIGSNGNRIGPYRVWEANTNSPGLAMSRSLGDVIGKQIGVIATPLCTEYELRSHDCFIVLASDGIWDVMDNEDVVNFVECFRGKCRQGGLRTAPKNAEIVPSVACVAQLLCEEARVRWYTVVEDEDVLIDDISCVVLEFKRSEGGGISFIPRKNTVVEEVQDKGEGEVEEDDLGMRKAPTINDILTRDPRRGSFVVDKIM